MLQEPNCYKRHCKHYIGILQPDDTELDERNQCDAFLTGIPDDIAYGDNLHLIKDPRQTNNIVYEREPLNG